MGSLVEIEKMMVDICRAAKEASRSLVSLSAEKKNQVLVAIARKIEERKIFLQQENKKDLQAGREKGLSDSMIDRLTLSDAVVESMIKGVLEVVALDDPIGTVDHLKIRPNGLKVGRVRIPLGVVSMIYESRPNVTVDAAVLCLKTGNGVVLRGGSEALHSNMALAAVLKEALQENGVESDAVQVIPVTDREAINILLQQEAYVDLIIPRGGEGLIRFVSENSRIPVLKHYKGVCHIYVDEMADLSKASEIIINSKVQRPGVCNALEGLLVHKNIAEKYLPEIVNELDRHKVKVYGCDISRTLCPEVESAEGLWGTEFLGLEICLKVVDSYEDAKKYIQEHGSNHTEVILTENLSIAERFLQEIDASAVMVNASTRFNDGGQLGLGTEIGISTTKLHAYGPMGLEELTTRKFVVYGSGQVRD